MNEAADHIKDHAPGPKGAAERRRTVVDTALSLFVERGYGATSFIAVATRAEVPIDSIIRSFGTKEALAKAAFDVALAGDHDEIALADRPEDAAIVVEPTASGKLRGYAELAADRHRRTAAILLMIRAEHRADAALGLVWETILEERLRAMMDFATHLLQTGGIKPELDLTGVGDLLFWASAIDHYDLLVLQRGWSRDRYAAWLGQLLVTTLT